MKKITLGIVIVLIFGIVGFEIYTFINADDDAYLDKDSQIGLKDATYIVEGKPITLRDGISEEEIAPGSASKLVTRYFGNDAEGDLNNDGKEDVVFLLTQDGGGSGTFYYVVALLDILGERKGTNAIFLGDRISPQTTETREGKIIVNYADRDLNESMAVSPSVGVSKYFRVEEGVLIETNQGDVSEIPDSTLEDKKKAIIAEYDELNKSYNLKYKAFNLALATLRTLTSEDNVFPDRIDFYVPGKIPREDGNPYFIFNTVIDMDKNDCLKGYMSLMSGEIKSWHDVCIIYN